MGALKPWHLILVVAVLVILFGSKKLPDAARSLGRSMRIFKAETKALSEDGKDGKDATAEKADAQVTAQQPLDGQASAKPVVDPVQRQQS
ncbi:MULTISPECIES: Sec-independent protein translocase subunit TatA [Catellatospora]|jgi:sec-independent protein translocase protein TatA|uniref:Sec-independent protein translocase protein TatA n=2 Tax=Catellatospora TaxID=53365 RepID=A0A8J3PA05_9ACTN|nr:Sec-independent protein translocase subunit TatA [Catellatospora coxensis]GIG09781.1 Sec-independent protein translocase protein TatA [Catellatospora coxensis]